MTKGIYLHDCPRISIVTVNYNQRFYLEKCIDSILSQNYPNLDYIILDGGSTDGSKELIQRYEKHLSFWRSEKDGGAYVAVNEGLKLATGEIMGWLNSDDMLHINGLEVIAHVFSKLPSVEWITGARVGFNAQGSLQSFGAESQLWNRGFIIDSDNFSGENIYTIMQEGTYWRKSLWQRAGNSLDLNYKLAADFELWARFSRFSHLYSVKERTGGFREHGSEQRSKKFRAQYIQECLDIIKREATYKPLVDKELYQNKKVITCPISLKYEVKKTKPLSADSYIIHLDSSKPKISIVTQCLNNEDTLERCIDSVLTQKDANFEFIVIDQGSRDNSLSIIKRVERHISNWETVKSPCIFDTLNVGFKQTTGQLMYWLDPNAIVLNNGLSQITNAFLSNPNVAWITGLPAAINAAGEIIWIYSRLPVHSRATVCFTNWEDPWIFPESTVWSRALWNIAGGSFNTKWRYAGEMDLWRRFFRYAQLYSLPSIIAAAEPEYALNSKEYGIRYYQEAKRIMTEEYEIIQKGEFTNVVPPPEPIHLTKPSQITLSGIK